MLATISEDDKAKQMKNLDFGEIAERRSPGLVLGHWKRHSERGVWSHWSPCPFHIKGLANPPTPLQSQVWMGWSNSSGILKTMATMARRSETVRFQVNRCVKPKNFGQVKTVQLHNFCDASAQGYGVVSFLRFTNGTGEVHIAFVMGKSRVILLKTMTIPRLELASATLAAWLDNMLQSGLQIVLQDSIFQSQKNLALFTPAKLQWTS